LGAPNFFVDHDVAAAGAQSHLHGIRQGVHARLELLAGFDVKLDEFTSHSGGDLKVE